LIEKLEIRSTPTTLGIILDPVTHQLFFSGISYPTNPITFFQPVLEWVETYLQESTNHKITINLHMSYFNTSSSTFLFRIMEMFDSSNKKYGNVKVLWHYEDEEDDVLDEWKSLLYDLDLSFDLVKIDPGVN
jgi:hypothetical protein